MRSSVVMAGLLAFYMSSSVARAEIQKRGPQIWPGKNEISLHIGGQNGLNSYYVAGATAGGPAAYAGGPTSGFHFIFDYAYRVNDKGSWTLWLDAGLSTVLAGNPGVVVGSSNVLVGGSGSELAGFAGIKMKWRTPIPLVPYAKFNGQVAYIFNRYCGDNGVGVLGHVAGGAKYFLTKSIGVGLETGFSFGPAIYSGTTFGACPAYYYSPNMTHVEFYAALDFEAGVEFSF